MGRGSRHSKNAGIMNAEAMTYAEIKARGYGTSYERIGKDSLGNFDNCQLTLQTSDDPVCTPWGTIYSKKAILENLIYQKKKISRNLDLWSKFETEEMAKHKRRHEIELNSKLIQFKLYNYLNMSGEKVQHDNEKILEKANYETNQATVKSCLKSENFRKQSKSVKCFWTPNLSSQTEISPAVTNKFSKKYTLCPVTGKKLKLKDLTPLKFTMYTGDTKEGNTLPYHIDPISKDMITNRSHLVCLRPTGEVILFDTFKNLVEPDGIFHETDLIFLQKGGTGYIGHDGAAALASKHTYLEIGTGMTDLRGQHSGATVKSGLVLL